MIARSANAPITEPTIIGVEEVEGLEKADAVEPLDTGESAESVED